ncbi:MAG TPA: hypothetical protein VE978_06620 [Chitinophagales bacterium]|nr:hypothetical protein [Chitinophagales bacterium]
MKPGFVTNRQTNGYLYINIINPHRYIFYTSKFPAFLLALASIIIMQSACKQRAPEIEWEKSFGGSQLDEAACIKQTSDSGYIVAGKGGSLDGDETGNHGFTDFWIIKLDQKGNLVWQKAYGGTYYDEAQDIQQTAEGGYIVAGGTYSSNGDVKGHHQRGDAWIIKLDAIGNLEWQKQVGGRDHDFAYSVQQAKDGGYVVAGVTDSKDGVFKNNHGGQDVWIFKLDENGNFLWQKLFGGSGIDGSYDIQQTKDGGFVVACSIGLKDDGKGNSREKMDSWIIKLDEKGNLQWQKTYGGSDYDIANSIYQTSDGGYIGAVVSESKDGDISGNHGYSDYWIIKLDDNGNLQWKKSAGGNLSDIAYSVLQTTDDGFVIAGYTSSVEGDISKNHGLQDYWIIKLNGKGKLQWEKSLGGSGNDWAYSILQSADGGYVIAGKSDSKDGDVTGNHGDDDYWIVKLKPEK